MLNLAHVYQPASVYLAWQVDTERWVACDQRATECPEDPKIVGSIETLAQYLTEPFETDVENDPTEENDLSSTEPQIVQKLYAALQRFNASQIDQSTAKDRNAKGEPCGGGLSCAVPWLPTPATITCPGAPPPIKPQPPGPPPAPSPPGPSPPSKLRSHLTQAANWKITASSIALHGWACYDSEKQAPTITLTVDGQDAQHVLASGTSHGACSGSATFGTFSAVLTAGKKTHLLRCHFIYTQNDPFTKTGSGQT